MNEMAYKAPETIPLRYYYIIPQITACYVCLISLHVDLNCAVLSHAISEFLR